MLRMPSRLRCAAVLLVLAGVSACSTALPPLGQNDRAIGDDERAFWDESSAAHEQLAAAGLLHEDAALVGYLNGLAGRVAVQLGGGEARPRVYVLRSPAPVAFAMPNGDIYLALGILPLVDNEAQLATLLGHEEVHWLHRHAAEQARATARRRSWVEPLAAVLGLSAAMVTGEAGLAALAMDESARSLASHELAYSRDQEREADRLGSEAARALGYDIGESAAFFAGLGRFMDEEGLAPDESVSGHPTIEERVAVIRALGGAGDGIAGVEPYANAVAAALPLVARMDVAAGRPHLARRALERRLSYAPDDADARCLLADVERLTMAGDTARARAVAAYERCLAVDPERPEAHRELGLLLRPVDGSRARAELQRYLELRPDAPDRAIVQAYVRDAGGGR